MNVFFLLFINFYFVFPQNFMKSSSQEQKNGGKASVKQVQRMIQKV